jgi:ABC-type transporter Mla subunit MlaD
MPRAALVLLVALVCGACAQAKAPTEASAATETAITGLDERVATLETDLTTAQEDIESGDKDLDHLVTRIDNLADKLDRSLERLREALEGVKGGSADARDQAAAALANAQSVASDLAVLEQRYEYHLRRYHGGGG